MTIGKKRSLVRLGNLPGKWTCPAGFDTCPVQPGSTFVRPWLAIFDTCPVQPGSTFVRPWLAIFDTCPGQPGSTFVRPWLAVCHTGCILHLWYHNGVVKLDHVFWTFLCPSYNYELSKGSCCFSFNHINVLLEC